MLQEQNKHWREGFFYGYRKKREVFKELMELLQKKQVIAIHGLRRVGKTVLMWQLIDHLVRNGMNRRNILYFSYDKAKLSVEELLKEYKKITGVDIEKEKVYVFLDEVQKLENWQEQVKFYYDLYGIKFVVSGSSSLFLKKGIESLAGRIFEINIPVLSFREFLDFKNVKIKDIELQKLQIKNLFQEYLRKNFIEILDEEEKIIKLYYESIINKVIFEDIPGIFDIENPEKLKALFYFILENPGMYINYDNLASYLSLNRRTVEKYLDYLVKANLVAKVYNFRKNFIISEKKMKRVYLTAPCFCFLMEFPKIDKIVENLAIVSERVKFFYRGGKGEEVDIVKKEKGKITAIEVKNSNKITKSEIKSLLSFMNRYGVSEGTVLTDDYEGKREETWFGKRMKINFIPLWKWVLWLDR